MARNYSSIAGVKTLASDITSSSQTQLTLTESTDDLPSPPFMLVINPDTAKEEIVLVQTDQTGVSEPTYKIVRGQDDTTPTTHTAGHIVKHMIVGSDLQLPHDHIDNTSAHDATGGVVGRTKNQILTTKTINLADNTLTGTKAQFNTAMSDADFATLTGTETLTNKTLTSPVLNSPTFDSGSLAPVGSVTMWVTGTAPTGWLLCQGQAVSRTTYASLFSVISTTYGVGDNSTTFNLPDFLGRVPMGAGTGTGLTARTLGAEVGSESTTLTSSHIPQHAHTINHGHTGSGSTSISGGDHAHDVSGSSSGTNTHDHGAGSYTETAAQGIGSDGAPSISASVLSGAATSAGHSHTASTSVTVDSMTGNSGNYGTLAPTAVTAVQPSTVINFIIKF